MPAPSLLQLRFQSRTTAHQSLDIWRDQKRDQGGSLSPGSYIVEGEVIENIPKALQGKPSFFAVPC